MGQGQGGITGLGPLRWCPYVGTGSGPEFLVDYHEFTQPGGKGSRGPSFSSSRWREDQWIFRTRLEAVPEDWEREHLEEACLLEELLALKAGSEVTTKEGDGGDESDEDPSDPEPSEEEPAPCSAWRRDRMEVASAVAESVAKRPMTTVGEKLMSTDAAAEAHTPANQDSLAAQCCAGSPSGRPSAVAPSEPAAEADMPAAETACETTAARLAAAAPGSSSCAKEVAEVASPARRRWRISRGLVRRALAR